MLYRKSLTAHQWTPPVPANLAYISNERQWLLVEGSKKRCAFLHVYIACQSNSDDSYIQWNEDLFHLITQEAIKLRQQGFITLAMGDFNTRVGQIPGLEGNTPDTNYNTPKFLTFLSQVNLVIINTLPLSKGLFTRFMDSSGQPGTRSLLDYGLIDAEHTNTVTSFVIDEQARYGCGTDHALLECSVVFSSIPKLCWSFNEAIQYNIRADTDYTEYTTNLDIISSKIALSQFSCMPAEEMLPHISESIKLSAMKSFGLKIKRQKKGITLPKTLISTIKAKNELARQVQLAAQTSPPTEVETLQQQLDTLKSLIKDTICEYQLKHRYRVRSKLLLADPSRKKFWRFLKSQIKTAGNISAMYDPEGKMVFEQAEIENAVLHHFSKIFKGQTHPVFPIKTPDAQQQLELSILEIEQIIGHNTPTFAPDHFEKHVCCPYSYTELDEVLKKLPSGKASGYDGIPNETLQSSTVAFKLYLQTFLNKILETGVVPQSLNLGKCMLIPKVRLKYLSFVSSDLFINCFQGGDALQPVQYRPITIPSNLLRLITVRLYDRMTEAVEANGLLGPEQFGFRRGRSTLDATFVLTTLLMKAKRKR